jgi:hypothetical protein
MRNDENSKTYMYMYLVNSDILHTVHTSYNIITRHSFYRKKFSYLLVTYFVIE